MIKLELSEEQFNLLQIAISEKLSKADKTKAHAIFCRYDELWIAIEKQRDLGKELLSGLSTEEATDQSK